MNRRRSGIGGGRGSTGCESLFRGGQQPDAVAQKGSRQRAKIRSVGWTRRRGGAGSARRPAIDQHAERSSASGTSRLSRRRQQHAAAHVAPSWVAARRDKGDDRSILMRTLIYKRTHIGDPDVSGTFGIHDCMGQVRSWGFDAVIGVGGIGDEPRRCNIAGKLTWIGIGAHLESTRDRARPLITFDHFLDYGEAGRLLSVVAPQLAVRMYKNNVRVLVDHLSATERNEVHRILALARNAPASPGRERAKHRFQFGAPRSSRGRPDKPCRCRTSTGGPGQLE
jgi:hypothetical protein